jgi:hypothetical protein
MYRSPNFHFKYTPELVLPEAHGKGYAEAAMRHAIEQGRQTHTTLTRMTLHASDMGRPSKTFPSPIVLRDNETQPCPPIASIA